MWFIDNLQVGFSNTETIIWLPQCRPNDTEEYCKLAIFQLKQSKEKQNLLHILLNILKSYIPIPLTQCYGTAIAIMPFLCPGVFVGLAKLISRCSSLLEHNWADYKWAHVVVLGMAKINFNSILMIYFNNKMHKVHSLIIVTYDLDVVSLCWLSLCINYLKLPGCLQMYSQYSRFTLNSQKPILYFYMRIGILSAFK